MKNFTSNFSQPNTSWIHIDHFTFNSLIICCWKGFNTEYVGTFKMKIYHAD